MRPGNVEIPVGRNLEVTNVFSGRPPKDPRLQWRPAGSSQWQTVALTNSPAGIARLTLTNIRCDTFYRATGGDGVSETYAITTYVPPAVKDLTVTIRFPGLHRLEARRPKIRRHCRRAGEHGAMAH